MLPCTSDSLGASGIRVRPLDLDTHRFEIRRIGRRETKIVHLKFYIECVHFDDPLRSNEHRGRGHRIQPTPIVLRIFGRLAIEPQQVSLDRVPQIACRDFPRRNLVVTRSLPDPRRNHQLITFGPDGIAQALFEDRIPGSQLEVELILFNPSRPRRKLWA